MKVGRVDYGGRPHTAIFDPEHDAVKVLSAEVQVMEILTEGDVSPALIVAEPRLTEVRLLAPLEPPAIRDFSVFEQHIEGIMLGHGIQEVPESWYQAPFFYFTNPGAVVGPFDEVAVPPGCKALDLELEVAAVVGRAGSNLSVEHASHHIAGYTILNDWSARDLQFEEMKLGLGICKGKDFANALGPWIVTRDELEPFRDGDRLDLDMRAELNGRHLGGDTLANMAWSFEQLVVHASRGTWIRPGDVLGSGTCGSGSLVELRGRHGAESYPWLEPGDTVSLTVAGIGTLTNTVVAGVDPHDMPRARPGRLRDRAHA